MRTLFFANITKFFALRWSKFSHILVNISKLKHSRNKDHAKISESTVFANMLPHEFKVHADIEESYFS